MQESHNLRHFTIEKVGRYLSKASPTFAEIFINHDNNNNPKSSAASALPQLFKRLSSIKISWPALPRMVFLLKETRDLLLADRYGCDLILSCPVDGHIRDIDFRLGPPETNRMPMYIIIDGESHFLCDIRAEFPVFERLGHLFNECTAFPVQASGYVRAFSIDSGEYTTFFTAYHVSRDSGRDVSALKICQSGKDRPVHILFCYSEVTLQRLYGAVKESLVNYSQFFDTPGRWSVPGHLFGLPQRNSDRLLKQIYSKFLELRSTDSNCQKEGIHLQKRKVL